MEIELSDIHKEIQDNVGKIVDGFGDDYWSNLDQTGEFPHEFHRAMEVQASHEPRITNLENTLDK